MQFKTLLLGLAAILPTLAVPTPNAIEPRSFIQLFPNLIINVDRFNTGSFYPSAYAADMSSQFSTVFSFDIPYSINPTCSLKFELPPPGGLFRYIVEGSGTLTVYPINGVVTNPTSYGTVAPLLGAPSGTFVASPSGGVAGLIPVPCRSGSTFQVVCAFSSDIIDY
jgi:hypothetical protein